MILDVPPQMTVGQLIEHIRRTDKQTVVTIYDPVKEERVCIEELKLTHKIVPLLFEEKKRPLV